MITIDPLLILALGVTVALGMIVVLRLNAFLALITAAVVVSMLAPGPADEKISRVATAFGDTAGSIGIVIAMAAIIGKCLMDSGAADRIVSAFLKAVGEQRGGTALAGSGFVLSVPVFYDTVFYLLIPLARSTCRRVGGNYVKLVSAIAAGAAVTHTMVPPTPGPMFIADELGVDLGMMIIVGMMIGLPMSLAGLAYASWIDRRMPVEMRPLTGEVELHALPQPDRMPGLFVSMLPIALPVVFIAANTILSRLVTDGAAGSPLAAAAKIAAVLGNPNLALLISAAIAVLIYVRQRAASRTTTAAMLESALMSSGMIILITAAGGAFGSMLKAAQIGTAISQYFSDSELATGWALLVMAFGVASLLKFSQGSSTVAMITASGMVAAMLTPETQLGFHPVYLGTAIGSGSLVGTWMNDSGFWIFSRMGGFSETETLKIWTPLLGIMGITGMLVTCLLILLLPLENGLPLLTG